MLIIIAILSSLIAIYFLSDISKVKSLKVTGNKYFNDKFELYSKKELLDNNIFGTGKKHHLIDDIVGEFVAIAKDKYYFMQSVNSHLFKGAHAGGLKEEMEVPIIIINN